LLVRVRAALVSIARMTTLLLALVFYFGGAQSVDLPSKKVLNPRGKEDGGGGGS